MLYPRIYSDFRAPRQHHIPKDKESRRTKKDQLWLCAGLLWCAQSILHCVYKLVAMDSWRWLLSTSNYLSTGIEASWALTSPVWLRSGKIQKKSQMFQYGKVNSPSSIFPEVSIGPKMFTWFLRSHMKGRKKFQFIYRKACREIKL